MNILFLVAPHIGVLQKKTYIGLPVGAANFSGILESIGHTVHVHDLDYKLTQVRNYNFNSDNFVARYDKWRPTLNIINKKDRFPKELENDLKVIVEDIPTDDIDMVIFSMVCNETAGFSGMMTSFSTSHLIIDYLNLDKDIPIVFGGGKYFHDLTDVANPNFDDIEYKYRQTYVLDKGIPEKSLEAITQDVYKVGLLDVKKKYDKKINTTRYKFDLDHKVGNSPEELFAPEVMEKYPKLKDIGNFHLGTMKFSEGCLFKCKFCLDGAEKEWTVDPNDDVVDQLQKGVDNGVTDFMFINTNINFSIKKAIDFANKVVQRGLKIRFSDSANLNFVSQEMFQALAEAGCNNLWYGTETINDELLKSINKRNTKERVINSLTWAHEAGIINCCNTIYNLPHENDAQFLELVEFMEDGINKGIINTFKANNFRLYRSTEYFTKPEENGIILRQTKDDPYTISNKFGGVIFDEVDGVTFEERMRAGKIKSNTMYGLADANVYEYYWSSTFMLAARKAGYNKQEILDIINCMGDVDPKLAQSYKSFHNSSALRH